jgi:hypothetical protein
LSGLLFMHTRLGNGMCSQRGNHRAGRRKRAVKPWKFGVLSKSSQYFPVILGIVSIFVIVKKHNL